LLLWSGAHAAAPLVIYDNALQSGYADGSWGNASDRNLANTTPVYGASGNSIRYVARGWNGLQFVANGSEFNFADYQSVTVYVNGGSAGGQKLQLYICDNYNRNSNVYPVGNLVAGSTIPANAWVQATVDFDSAGLTFGTFNCLVIMDADGSNDAAGQPAAFI